MLHEDQLSANNKLARILDALGVKTHALLGQGSESWVFALDNDRIARINKGGASRSQVNRRTSLLAELCRSSQKVSFAIPAVLDTLEIEGHVITIEQRLPGRPLIELMAGVAGEMRAALIRAYLDAASQIGDLEINRPWYGDLLAAGPIRAGTYPDYLQQRAATSLKAAGPPFKHVAAASLAAALPQPDRKALVHLDGFAGNMLAEGTTITAVLDFGPSCLIGDRRLDPLAAAVYLDPAITPTAIEADHQTAQEWLAARGLARHFTAVQNWLAAYWSFAIDDTNLYKWCQRILVA